MGKSRSTIEWWGGGKPSVNELGKQKTVIAKTGVFITTWRKIVIGRRKAGAKKDKRKRAWGSRFLKKGISW